jgi:hypothetical protein
MSTHRPFTSYWSGFAGLMRSMYRSCTSGPTFVTPHAIRSLWPTMTHGVPGNEKPRTWNGEPAFLPGWASVAVHARSISYQIEGIWMPRCGSLARIGLPLAVRDPAMTQLLLPMPAPVPKARPAERSKPPTSRVGTPASAAGSSDDLDAAAAPGRPPRSDVGSSSSATMYGMPSWYTPKKSALRSDPIACSRSRAYSSRFMFPPRSWDMILSQVRLFTGVHGSISNSTPCSFSRANSRPRRPGRRSPMYALTPSTYASSTKRVSTLAAAYSSSAKRRNPMVRR